jgi:hypothetical protein
MKKLFSFFTDYFLHRFNFVHDFFSLFFSVKKAFQKTKLVGRPGPARGRGNKSRYTIQYVGSSVNGNQCHHVQGCSRTDTHLQHLAYTFQSTSDIPHKRLSKIDFI